jgi:hypothetical protein
MIANIKQRNMTNIGDEWDMLIVRERNREKRER